MWCVWCVVCVMCGVWCVVCGVCWGLVYGCKTCAIQTIPICCARTGAGGGYEGGGGICKNVVVKLLHQSSSSSNDSKWTWFGARRLCVPIRNATCSLSPSPPSDASARACRVPSVRGRGLTTWHVGLQGLHGGGGIKRCTRTQHCGAHARKLHLQPIVKAIDPLLHAVAASPTLGFLSDFMVFGKTKMTLSGPCRTCSRKP